MNLAIFQKIVSRKESFGGIIFFPSFNSQVAVNEGMFILINILRETHCFSDAVLTVSRIFSVTTEIATELIEKAILSISENLEKFNENKDSTSDWGSEAIFLSAPLMIIVEVIKSCNQGCLFCSQQKDCNFSDIELSSPLLEKIIKESEELGVFKIQYMGGEPLVKKDFMNFFLLSCKKGIFSSFTTNGLLLDRILNQLKDAENTGKLLPVQVSIHGITKESVSVFGIEEEKWKKTVDNVRLLKENGIPFGIKTIVSCSNSKNILKSIEFFRDLGAYAVTLMHFIPIGGGEDMKEEAKFSDEELKEIFHQIELSCEKFPEVHIDFRSFLNLYFPKKPKTTLDSFVRCPSGSLDLRIRYDGKVIQCSNLRVPIGDISKESIKQVWSSAKKRMKKCPLDCNRSSFCF